MATPATPAQQSLRVEMLDKMAVLITTAFGLVAALAWNTAIQAVFDTYLAAGSDIVAKLGYAVLVTVIAVILVIYIGKLAAKAKERVARPRA